jgi:lysylphosphatidylglycerol synthetase-like protein (DUF2156 family)
VSDQPTTTQARPWAASAVAGLAVIAALASVIMALAHLGIPIPVILEDAIVLPPVAIGFVVATILCLVVAVGALRATSWGWWTGLVVFALAVVVIAGSPARNWLSYTVLVASIIAIAVLLSRPGREAYGRG